MSRSRFPRFMTTGRTGRFGSRSGSGRDSVVLRRIIPLAYLIIGLVVASQHGYFTHLTTFGRILSAVLAVLLWPLVLLGVQLTIK